MSFSENLEFGRAGESLIAKFLRDRGNTVLPAYEKVMRDYKGPQIFGPSRSFTAPDFLTWNGPQACWIEAKQKSAFTWHRISSRWVTGIDLHHYQDYCAIDDESPWPVWLLFLHQPGVAKDSPSGCPTGLFGNSLKYLRKNENHRHENGGRRGMVYWAHDSLKLLAGLDQIGRAAA